MEPLTAIIPGVALSQLWDGLSYAEDGLRVVSAFVGVHPVIAITTVGTWLAPLAPDPTLLAGTLTMGWAIGVPAGPLSGLHLAMQGRYGISTFAFQRWNAAYIPKLLAASILALHVQGALRGL